MKFGWEKVAHVCYLIGIYLGYICRTKSQRRKPQDLAGYIYLVRRTRYTIRLR